MTQRTRFYICWLPSGQQTPAENKNIMSARPSQLGRPSCINTIMASWLLHKQCVGRCDLVISPADIFSHKHDLQKINHTCGWKLISELDVFPCVFTCFHMRGFWISKQKFEISPVAPTTTIFILQPHYGKCDPSQIGIIHIWLRPHFQGDSESDHQNLKFTPP
jgi:hypothetical protein